MEEIRHLTFYITEEQRKLLVMFMSEIKNATRDMDIFDVLAQYKNCSIKGESFAAMEEDVAILNKYLLAMQEDEREIFLKEFL